jgi:hypothetical protein
MNQLANYGQNQLAKNENTSVDIARAIKEVEASIIMANRFPRDEDNAKAKVMKSLTNISLAQKAIYSYPRGKEQIEGPSIRLAESLARCMKHLQYGIRELAKAVGPDGYGVTLVEAFCFDLENNIRITKEFTVKHSRQTKTTEYALTSDRDIYELVANQGARRLRACILACVPADIVECAVDQANKTMLEATTAGKMNLKEKIANMIELFAEIDVPQKAIEKYIGTNIEKITTHQIVKLGKIYNSIKDNIAKPGEYFELETINTFIAARDEEEGLKNVKIKIEESFNRLIDMGEDKERILNYMKNFGETKEELSKLSDLLKAQIVKKMTQG